MTTPPTDFRIRTTDAARTQASMAQLAPRWTTWAAQTLARHGPLCVPELMSRLPFIRGQSARQCLLRMSVNGLVTRSDGERRATYQLTARGRALTPVHRSLDEWSLAHLAVGQTAQAERIEDALQRLAPRHSTAIIQLLSDGPMRFQHLAEAAGLDSSLAGFRLNRLRRDGLIERTCPQRGAPYALTTAGHALGPVFAAVQEWSTTATDPYSHAPGVGTIRSHHRTRSAPDELLTAAALSRAPAVPAAVFSHAPEPQPPATATRITIPSHGRAVR